MFNNETLFAVFYCFWVFFFFHLFFSPCLCILYPGEISVLRNFWSCFVLVCCSEQFLFRWAGLGFGLFFFFQSKRHPLSKLNGNYICVRGKYHLCQFCLSWEISALTAMCTISLLSLDIRTMFKTELVTIKNQESFCIWSFSLLQIDTLWLEILSVTGLRLQSSGYKCI